MNIACRCGHPMDEHDDGGVANGLICTACFCRDFHPCKPSQEEREDLREREMEEKLDGIRDGGQ